MKHNVDLASPLDLSSRPEFLIKVLLTGQTKAAENGVYLWDAATQTLARLEKQ